MIIWRGWGIVGFFLIIGGVALTMGLSGHNSSGTPAGVVAAGAGLLLGGAACAAFGYWLNVTRPRSKADEYLEGLRQELWQRVRAGAFQVEAGAPAPRDEAEATQQVEHLVAQQSQDVRRGLRNRNTLFFIPIHWLGALAVIGGVVFIILGAAGTTLCPRPAAARPFHIS